MLLDDIQLAEKVRCLSCGASIINQPEETKFSCPHCGYSYKKFQGVWNLMEYTDESQKDIQNFWGDLYQQLYEKSDKNLSPEKLDYFLSELKILLENFEQPLGVEIDLSLLHGKTVLEIGCGAGAHSSLMKKAGAKIISVDITPERVFSTHQKLTMIPQGQGLACQANCEKLPFKDKTFDLVYSFGVLHHTTHTETAINEVYRVIKPGGQAVIMLYAKRSLEYYKLCLKAFLTGALFKGSNWLGRISEGKPKYRQTYNPYTRCYTPKELKKMFGQFSQIKIRKNAFSLSQIPKLGPVIEKWLVKKGTCTESDGGFLVWDKPLRRMTPLEIKLGRWIGFAYNISCTKLDT